MGRTLVRTAVRRLACASVVALGVAGAGWPAVADEGGEGGGGDAMQAPPGGGGGARPQALSELPNTERLLRAGSGARTTPPAPTRRGGWNAERPVELPMGGLSDNGLRYGARIEIPSTDSSDPGPIPPSVPRLGFDPLLDQRRAPPAESATAPKGPPMMLRVDEATGQTNLLVHEDFVRDGVPDFEAAARAYRDYYGSEPPFPVPPNPPRAGSASGSGGGVAEARQEYLQRALMRFDFGSGGGTAVSPPRQGAPTPAPTPGSGGATTTGPGTQPTYVTPSFSGFDLDVRYSPAGIETRLRGALQSEDSALMESAIREFGTPEARAELDRQKGAQNQAAPQPRRAGGGR